MKSHTIREYEPGDEHGILQLLNDVFAEDDPDYQPRTLAEWQWEYDQNPAGREIIVAVEDDGRVVGHYACLPARAQLAGRIVQCGQGVDSMVAREYRRSLKSEGLFLRTARCYFETFGVPDRNAYGYGFPNKKAFRIGARMLSYQPVHVPVLTLGCNLFSDSAADASGCPEVVQLQALDERVDRLWGRVAGDVGMGIVRDRRYLEWRYLDCPRADYQVFGLPDSQGELGGLYVSRANWTGPPILAMSDLIVPEGDEDVVTSLARHAVEMARETGQHRVEVWCRPGSWLFGVVQACGFKVEESPFNLCVRPYEAGLERGWMRDNWHFSIGDADVF